MTEINGIMDVKVPGVLDLTEETERVYRGFRQVGQGIYEAFSGIAAMFSKVVKDMVSPFMETLSTYLSGVFEWCEVKRKAKELGLVSDRVLWLTEHRKVRVGKKNCNRIRKEVRLYEKRSVSAGHGKRWEQARWKAARDGGRDCARTEKGRGTEYPASLEKGKDVAAPVGLEMSLCGAIPAIEHLFHFGPGF